MNYYKTVFKLQPILPAREVLVAELAERGYESFVESETGLEAYIQEPDFSEDLLKELQAEQVCDYFSVINELVPAQNWNAQWEESFQPIEVESAILIKAPFHTQTGHYKHEIFIEPKMSFGTGHHDTTYLMMAEMLHLELTGKRVLDMGSGTGILGILAMQLHAAEVDAIDIDEWAYNNIFDNLTLNHVEINAFLGGAELLAERAPYDVILANINRNILTRDMGEYNKVLKPGGEILFSGFYESDFTEIDTHAKSYDWTLVSRNTRNEWCMLRYKK